MRNKVFDFEAVGARICAARTALHKTQAEIAAACGCDPKHLSAIENGRKKPSIELLMKLSKALNVTTDYILQDSEYISDVAVEIKISDLFKQMNGITKQNAIGILENLVNIQNSNMTEQPD